MRLLLLQNRHGKGVARTVHWRGGHLFASVLAWVSCLFAAEAGLSVSGVGSGMGWSGTVAEVAEMWM